MSDRKETELWRGTIPGSSPRGEDTEYRLVLVETKSETFGSENYLLVRGGGSFFEIGEYQAEHILLLQKQIDELRERVEELEES